MSRQHEFILSDSIKLLCVSQHNKIPENSEIHTAQNCVACSTYCKFTWINVVSSMIVKCRPPLEFYPPLPTENLPPSILVKYFYGVATGAHFFSGKVKWPEHPKISSKTSFSAIIFARRHQKGPRRRQTLKYEDQRSSDPGLSISMLTNQAVNQVNY